MGLMIVSTRGGYRIHDTDAPMPPAGAKVTYKTYKTMELAEKALRQQRAYAEGKPGSEGDEEPGVSEEEVRKRFGIVNDADGKWTYFLKSNFKEMEYDSAEARDKALAAAVKRAHKAEVKKLKDAREGK